MNDLFEKNRAFEESVPMFKHVRLSSINELQSAFSPTGGITTPEKKRDEMTELELMRANNEALKMIRNADGLSTKEPRDYRHSLWTKLSELATNGQLVKDVCTQVSEILEYKQYDELRMTNLPFYYANVKELDRLSKLSE